MEETIAVQEFCGRAGYLPIPLRCLPPKSLNEFEIFLADKSGYSLYRGRDVAFTVQDRDRLLENGVECVYVSTNDHDRYYHAIEANIREIVTTPQLQIEKQHEILYATGLELAGALLKGEFGADEAERADNMCEAIVEIALRDREAFRHLFDVANHDFYTATHVINVCGYAVMLARRLGCEDYQLLHNVAIGALLHDLGKASIPAEILNKVEPLTDEEFALIKTHVQEGVNKVQEVAHLSPESMSAISQHHERLDGSGYPHGLSGDGITLIGRIIAVVDSFDAMTCVRPYRREAMAVEEALNILKNSPKAYDAEVVRTFAVLVTKAANGEALTDKAKQPGAKAAFATDDQPRRRHMRNYFRMVATIQPVKSKGDTYELQDKRSVVVSNFSRSGVGFICPQRIDTNMPMILSFPRQTSLKKVLLPIITVRRQDLKNGWFIMGAQFVRQLDQEAVDKIKQAAGREN